MLYNGSDVIRDLEWVIFDEVHYINDAEVRTIVAVGCRNILLLYSEIDQFGFKKFLLNFITVLLDRQ